jgi:uncharacterized protein (TIGR03435 family)
MRGVALTVVLVAVSMPAGSQTPLAFEAASIRRNVDNARGPTRFEPGRYVQTNAPIVRLLQMAYPTADRTVGPIGAPDWVLKEPYDIVATAGRRATQAEMEEMLRTMLRERFQLDARIEEREQDVFALVLARADGRLGADLQRSTVDCEQIAALVRAGQDPRAPNGAQACGVGGSTSGTASGVTITRRGGGQSMASFAASLSSSAGRVVIDRTGLTGLFDYTLRHASTLSQANDAPSIFTALQEQLGLKLEPSTGQVPVLVVSRIERPTEN